MVAAQAEAVALPALVQYFRVWKTGDYENPLWNGLMAPPVPASAHDNGELAEWYYEWGRDFELATVYTMVAGLLNVLAIFDAFAGPMQMPGDDKKKKLETTPPVTASSPGS